MPSECFARTLHQAGKWGAKFASRAAEPRELQDKAKLKFELFLNDRRSGTKVMLGQKFSSLASRAVFCLLDSSTAVVRRESWCRPDETCLACFSHSGKG